MADVRLDLDESAIRGLASDQMMQPLMQMAGDVVAAKSAELGSVIDAEGADSIHAEVDRDAEGWHADVSWSQDFFWMGFHETGTSKYPARPFLRPALDSTRI